MQSIKLYRLLQCSFFIVLFATFLCGYALWQVSDDDFSVHFFDVEQGDATLLSYGSNQVLIDGGSNGVVLLEELGSAMPFWDRTIEVVIATHPDSDHIGGLPDVLKNYSIEYFLTVSQSKESETFAVLQTLLVENNVNIHHASAGERLYFAQEIFLDIIYPISSDTSLISDANDASITTMLHILEEQFFFGGDLSKHIEDVLPVNDRVTILKASHHGSKTSTSEYFLKKIEPRDVIISSGKDNRYNHPSPEVLGRLKNHNLNIFRTDTHGTIMYRCSREAKNCHQEF